MVRLGVQSDAISFQYPSTFAKEEDHDSELETERNLGNRQCRKTEMDLQTMRERRQDLQNRSKPKLHTTDLRRRREIGGNMARPIIIVCECGKVKKFGEFIAMPPNVMQALKSGTYKKVFEACHE